MTDNEEAKEFLRKLFGEKREPADPDATPEQKFAHDLFNRDNND